MLTSCLPLLPLSAADLIGLLLNTTSLTYSSFDVPFNLPAFTCNAHGADYDGQNLNATYSKTVLPRTPVTPYPSTLEATTDLNVGVRSAEAGGGLPRRIRLVPRALTAAPYGSLHAQRAIYDMDGCSEIDNVNGTVCGGLSAVRAMLSQDPSDLQLWHDAQVMYTGSTGLPTVIVWQRGNGRIIYSGLDFPDGSFPASWAQLLKILLSEADATPNERLVGFAAPPPPPWGPRLGAEVATAGSPGAVRNRLTWSWSRGRYSYSARGATATSAVVFPDIVNASSNRAAALCHDVYVDTGRGDPNAGAGAWLTFDLGTRRWVQVRSGARPGWSGRSRLGRGPCGPRSMGRVAWRADPHGTGADPHGVLTKISRPLDGDAHPAEASAVPCRCARGRACGCRRCSSLAPTPKPRW